MKKGGRQLLTRRTLANILVVVVGVLLYMGLSNFGAVRDTIGWFFGVLSPFITGMALAYLLNMPVRFFERRIYKSIAAPRLKRRLSIITSYVLAILLLVWLATLVIPQVVQSVLMLVRNLPAYLDNLNAFSAWISSTFDIEADSLDFLLLSYSDLMTSLAEWIRSFLPQLVNVTLQVGSGIVSVLTALVASIYMLSSKEKLLRQVRRLLYAVLPVKNAKELVRICSLSNNVFSGFISGKLLDSAIIGGICFAFMWITQTPYAVLISIIVGFTNIIPFFGPFIGAIPSAMILLLVDPWRALWFIIFIIVLQQIDGNYIGPKILGSSTGLPALWVLIAIVVGGGLFGFMGMLLGVPVAAVFYALLREFTAKRLTNKGLSDEMIGLQESALPAPPAPPPLPPAGDAPVSDSPDARDD